MNSDGRVKVNDRLGGCGGRKPPAFLE